MGKSMYNYGTRTKERERQLKQVDQAAKRTLAKQRKAGLKTVTPSSASAAEEPESTGEIVKSTVC